MSCSFTLSHTTTFTITHARHMAAKVATDLKRVQRFYGRPADAVIADYESEIIWLLKAGYLKEVTYGFRRNGKWIEPTLRYTAVDLAGMASRDDDPGRVLPGADTSGASFWSFLSYSSAWFELTESERAQFQKKLPFRRKSATEPGIDGYLTADRTYSAGGRALNRSTVRSY